MSVYETAQMTNIVCGTHEDDICLPDRVNKVQQPHEKEKKEHI